MTITGVVFLPHPPLLVPAVAAGAAAELDALREACDRALREVLALEPELVVVAGADPRGGSYPAGTAGTLAPYGVGVRVVLGAPDAGGAPELPLPLTIGAWVLARTPWRGSVLGAGLGSAGGAPAALNRPGRVALLAMGDGTACRTPAAPGAFDPRAADADAAIAHWLAAGGRKPLGLDGQLAAELGVAGLRTWRLVEHAVAPEGPFEAAIHYADAPYGVGYFVATWRRDG